MDISYLGLSDYTTTHLVHFFRAKTVEDLCKIPPENLNPSNQVLQGSLDEIQDAFDQHGLLFNHPELGADIETFEFSDDINSLFHHGNIYLVGELRTKTEADLQLLGFNKEIRDRIGQKLEELHFHLCQGDIDISELGLSVRSYNCLRRGGVSSAFDLCHLTKDDLLTIRNMNKKSVSEIQEKLRERGFALNSKDKRLSSNDAIDILLNKIDEIDLKIAKTSQDMAALKSQYYKLDKSSQNLINQKNELRKQIKILVAVQNSDKTLDEILKSTE